MLNFFRRNKPEPVPVKQPKLWAFEPKPNISAHELALILICMERQPEDGFTLGGLHEFTDDLSPTTYFEIRYGMPEIARHFRYVPNT